MQRTFTQSSEQPVSQNGGKYVATRGKRPVSVHTEAGTHVRAVSSRGCPCRLARNFWLGDTRMMWMLPCSMYVSLTLTMADAGAGIEKPDTLIWPPLPQCSKQICSKPPALPGHVKEAIHTSQHTFTPDAGRHLAG